MTSFTSCRGASSDTRPFALVLPKVQTLPLVLASPHSGRCFDREFLAMTPLAKDRLRRLEDPYVDQLFAGAPARGAPLLAARFPRAYIDPNREPFELDPRMFAEHLPAWINSNSPRVRGGHGLIPRISADGAPIYAQLLHRADLRRRLAQCYLPYHRALKHLLADTRARFGYAVLLDCHSMPSAAVARPAHIWRAEPRRGVDFVLGDCNGASCSPALTACAEAALRRHGFTVARNTPYAGGFTTRFYGRPDSGVEALQIEVNRALYMNETSLTPTGGLAALTPVLNDLIDALGACNVMTRAAE